MNKITEIIPDEIPDWAKKAMDEGQFFNIACNIMNALEEIIVMDQKSMYERCQNCLTDSCSENKRCKDTLHSPIGLVAKKALGASDD